MRIFAATGKPELPFDFFDYVSVSMLIGIIIVLVLMMIGLLWVGWRYSLVRMPTGPYGKLPLRRAIELPYSTIGKTYLFLTGFHQYDNRMFNIHRAMTCRATGRIFPDSMDLFGRVKLDWTFLQKRFPGNYVSWGSLNDIQQSAIRRAHQSMEGFQTEFSCPDPSPRAITEEYALASPGPLYVDLESKVLLGWKRVPGTEVEVLVVQHPRKFF